MTDAPSTPRPKFGPGTESGGRFANINRPIAGRRTRRAAGRAPPVPALFAGDPERREGHGDARGASRQGPHRAEYHAWIIPINVGEQFGSGFVAINPNSKIPALLDRSTPDKPTRIFESGAILMHLAEKFGEFLPTEPSKRAECLSWLFWQMGAAPYLGGGFGHFYAYAPTKIEYAIDRFAMEVKRQLDVLDRRLAESECIAGPDYTIADMAIWPWYGALVNGLLYEAGEFLSVHESEHVIRWTEHIATRPAGQRGRMVNRAWGEPSSQLPERHDASDFDKVQTAE
jgi:GST-like protein